MRGADPVLEEIDQLRAMLLDVAGARREQGHLRGPHGLLQGEERAHAAGLVRLDGERGHLAHEIDPLLPERRNHVGEVDLDDAVVALLLHAVVKHDLADRHVDGAADAVGSQHLALEILDRLDRAVGEHHVLAGAVALDAVLVEICDDADIVHMRVLDREPDRGECQCRQVELARGKRSDLRRAAAKLHGLEAIGRPVVPQDVLLHEDDRGELARHHRPADPHLERLRSNMIQSDAEKQQREEYRKRPTSAH